MWEEHVAEKMDDLVGRAINKLKMFGYLEAELLAQSIACGCMHDNEASLKLSRQLDWDFFYWYALLDEFDKFSYALHDEYDNWEPDDE